METSKSGRRATPKPNAIIVKRVGRPDPVLLTEALVTAFLEEQETVSSPPKRAVS